MVKNKILTEAQNVSLAKFANENGADHLFCLKGSGLQSKNI
jgi:hypothetical protein